MRRRSSPLPRFTPQQDARRPLYLQVRDFLREAMLRGVIPPGGRLPSTRALATGLGVSRNSVMHAFEALAAEGLVSSRSGSGTRSNVSAARPKPRDLAFLVRQSHFPADPLPLDDPDGNPLYLHR